MTEAELQDCLDEVTDAALDIVQQYVGLFPGDQWIGARTQLMEDIRPAIENVNYPEDV